MRILREFNCTDVFSYLPEFVHMSNGTQCVDEMLPGNRTEREYSYDYYARVGYTAIVQHINFIANVELFLWLVEINMQLIV